jgi:broad specificity phosphatase PhoE
VGRRIAALTRHADYQQLADTPSAHQPFGLTAKGVKQAQQGAALFFQALQQQQWALVPEIHCSQMLRAWQTACHFRDHVIDGDATLHCFDALAERGLGAAANLTLEQIDQALRNDPRYEAPPANWKSSHHYRLPFQGAESLMEAGIRVAEHLRTHLSALPPQDGVDRVMLFVGHGASIRHAAYHLGILQEREITRLSMFHASTLFFEWLADGTWQHVAGEWKIRGEQPQELD